MRPRPPPRRVPRLWYLSWARTPVAVSAFGTRGLVGCSLRSKNMAFLAVFEKGALAATPDGMHGDLHFRAPL